MQDQWEYKVEYLISDKTNEHASILNYLGAHGWELVAVFQTSRMTPIYAYLKRRLDASQHPTYGHIETHGIGGGPGGKQPTTD